ncbi:uncharacterized protein LOC124300125 isoform X1 [Neodiprion virginianus]|uniref:uncharacterized protein LOC124174332 isoform X1 n=1 Tax=Neodiprion fabricii TaxID=2872261 RepID=UPI001ED91DE1|nr:uncharacterized protein LOC124174332 isoform X1 [Neodiprion fabricii]XP_046609781.1 uncharacterized protein LOC124300125 isoform X1 [Neodiprion virginianus]
MEIMPCSRPVGSSVVSKTPQRDEAFECYLKEDDSAMKLKNKLKEKEAARKAGQEVLMDLVLQHKRMKNEMESAKLELRKQQNIRHLTDNEVYDDEGRVLIPEIEQRLFNVVTNLEKNLSNIKCQVMQAEEELRQLVEDELDASFELECAFQTFCQKTYNQVVPKLEEDKSKDEATALEPIDATEQMRLQFVNLQKMMQRMIEVIFTNLHCYNSVEQRIFSNSD